MSVMRFSHKGSGWKVSSNGHLIATLKWIKGTLTMRAERVLTAHEMDSISTFMHDAGGEDVGEQARRLR